MHKDVIIVKPSAEPSGMQIIVESSMLVLWLIRGRFLILEICSKSWISDSKSTTTNAMV